MLRRAGVRGQAGMTSATLTGNPRIQGPKPLLSGHQAAA
jgi:hypothetical protein